MWNLSAVTPEFIAACAVLVSANRSAASCQTYSVEQMKFALSEDGEFHAFGTKSRIPYANHYRDYVHWIHKGLVKPNPDVRALVDDLNTFLFPRGSLMSAQSNEDDALEQAEALAMLD